MLPTSGREAVMLVFMIHAQVAARNGLLEMDPKHQIPAMRRQGTVGFFKAAPAIEGDEVIHDLRRVQAHMRKAARLCNHLHFLEQLAAIALALLALACGEGVHIETVVDFAKRHCGRPKRRASSRAFQIASSVG